MSSNKMKQTISENTVSEIFEKHSLGEIAEIKEMSGGYFNSVLKVETVTGDKYIIKIAPGAKTEVLTYEQDLIKSEVYIYSLLESVTSVHFPEVYACNYEGGAPYKYSIMEFLEGEMLNRIKLPSEQYKSVMHDLGKAMAEIHTITGKDGFGYTQNGLKPTWKEAYLSMVENVTADGKRKNARIPYLKTIKEIIRKNECVLDTVKTPSLIHFDLWAGNIMIKDGRLYGLIDCERAMFGDIMGEFISLDFASPFDLEKHKELIDGYNSFAKEKINFGRDEFIRLYLMKIYLGMIAYVEQYYRSTRLSATFYSARHFAKSGLKCAINELKKLNAI